MQRVDIMWHNLLKLKSPIKLWGMVYFGLFFLQMIKKSMAAERWSETMGYQTANQIKSNDSNWFNLRHNCLHAHAYIMHHKFGFFIGCVDTILAWITQRRPRFFLWFGKLISLWLYWIGMIKVWEMTYDFFSFTFGVYATYQFTRFHNGKCVYRYRAIQIEYGLIKNANLNSLELCVFSIVCGLNRENSYSLWIDTRWHFN